METLLVFGVAMILLSPFFREVFSKMSLPAMLKRWTPLVHEIVTQYNIDPDEILAIIYIESRGHAKAIGSANDLGLMQITPICLREYNNNHNITLEQNDLFDPRVNVTVGSWYWWYLKTHYHFDNIYDRARAYNAGPTSVRIGITHGSYTLGAEYANRFDSALEQIKTIRKGESDVVV